MRFIPTGFFNVGLEPCVSSSATHAISSSVLLGSVEYDVYLFTASQQEGGSGAEGGQLFIHDGYTKRAIITVVGGGGGGSSDGRGGGAGGILAQSNVSLYTGTYNIEIGQGANGTSRLGSAGLPFSGDNGSQSSFTADGISLIAGGGEGGNLGGFGGKSGIVNGVQNTASGTGGAGAGQSVTGSNSGEGYGFYTAQLNQYFMAGGGGQASSYSGNGTGYVFGGGGAADALGNGINGSGGAYYDNTLHFGGGGTGGQYYNSSTNTYVSSTGGAGCVMVAIPKNLCTSSLYIPNQNIVYDGLVNYYDFNNAKCIGKSLWGLEVNDLKYNTSLFLSSSGADTGGAKNNYSSSDTTLYYDTTYDSVGLNGLNRVIGARRQDILWGQSNFSASEDFTIEFIGKLPDTDANNQDRNIVSLATSYNTTDFQLVVDGFNPYTSIRNNGVESGAVVTNQTLAQHVITYDKSASQVKYYVNNSLQITFNTSISSSLYNPYIKFGDIIDYQVSSTSRDIKFKEIRIYDKLLSSLEIEQNYSASFGL